MAVTDYRGAEAGVATDLQGSGGTIDSNHTTTVHTGTYAYRVYPTTTGTGWVAIGGIGANGVPTTDSAAACGYSFMFRYATKPAANSEEIFTCRQGTNDRFTIRINSSGNLEFYDLSNATGVPGTPLATGSTVLSSGTWYRISGLITLGSGTGTATVKIDGVSEYSGSSLDTGATNFTLCAFGKRSNRNGQSVEYFIDNCVRDDAGEPDNWIIKRLPPTANGSTMVWSAGTNASNYLEVDEIPTDSATTYVATTATAGEIALFSFASLSTISASGSSNYRAVRISTYQNEPVLVTSSNSVRMRSNATNNSTTARNLPTSNDYACNQQIVNLGGGAWTEALIDAIEGGAIENNAVTVRMSTVYVEVLYAPPAAGVGNLPLLGVG